MHASVALVVVLAVCCQRVIGYHGGAGASACEGNSLMPSHGAAAQSGASPYSISTLGTTYTIGDSQVKVTLNGTEPFLGFLVIALDTASGSRVGRFDVVTNGAETLSQSRCTDGATHTSDFHGSGSSSIELMWNPPTRDVGEVKFYATFVKVQRTFWVKQESPALTAASGATPATPASNNATTTTTTAAATTTTAAATTTTTTTTTTATTTTAKAKSTTQPTMKQTTSAAVCQQAGVIVGLICLAASLLF